MPDRRLLLALHVSDSAEDGPDVAIVPVTPERLRQWIGEIDQVRLLTLAAQGSDARPYGVMYWDDSPFWLQGGGLAEDLAFMVDDDTEVTVQLTPAQERQLPVAERYHDAGADAVRRFVTAEQVNWRAHPKHGPGDWNTAHLNRNQMLELLADLTSEGAPAETTLGLPDPELQPVYLVVSNTDCGADAYIVRFASEDQMNAWWERVRELAGEGNEEPFGFRHEDGTTDRILTPDEALEIVRKANVVVCAECGKDMVFNGDGTTNHLLDGTVGVDAIDYDADEDHAAFKGMLA
jgi:hypothetical protein